MINLNSFKSWPKKDPNYTVGTNVIRICILGRRSGLTYHKGTKSFSVELGHPLTEYWLSILKPIWEKKNRGKCKICHGSGWDGETYSLSCHGCGGTGKST